MSTKSRQEIEAKFYLHALKPLQARLEKLGAQCVMPRCHEYNLRFDTPDQRLTRGRQVLRLRRSDDVRLTYKASTSSDDARIHARTEIETRLEDFENMKAILLALGYTVFWIYEKYRWIYRWGDALITLDETPLGYFSEIEAPSADDVLHYARQLGLKSAAACPLGYRALFLRAAARMNPSPAHMTFAAFDGKTPTASDLGLSYADYP